MGGYRHQVYTNDTTLGTGICPPVASYRGSAGWTRHRSGRLSSAWGRWLTNAFSATNPRKLPARSIIVFCMLRPPPPPTFFRIAGDGFGNAEQSTTVGTRLLIRIQARGPNDLQAFFGPWDSKEHPPNCCHLSAESSSMPPALLGGERSVPAAYGSSGRRIVVAKALGKCVDGADD
jgi:hypothetical protein